MKNLIIISLITLFCTNFTYGQNNQKGKIEAEKIAFFTRRLDLSPDEAKEFWPVYNEFADKRNMIKKEKNALLRSVNKEQGAIDDKELEENGDKVIEYMVKEAELTKEYHQKFKKILPAKKVIRIYQTESQFNRILIDQLRNVRAQQKTPGRRQSF